MRKIAPLSTLVILFILTVGCADVMNEDYIDSINKSQFKVEKAQDKLMGATSNQSNAHEKNRSISFSSKFTVWSVPPPPGNQIHVNIAVQALVLASERQCWQCRRQLQFLRLTFGQPMPVLLSLPPMVMS